ncbi:hypothetical protein ONE63_007292 [Megalurothrips usitatus]|uniref:Myb/SANT-like DNA-binding domain-containing protein n=1 Tax=Megalurothrips usitatus TaxID=439358 RepID=A0AAV7XV27_9NEOP|nr:hypothetical protein ONE63_007292 [Megalurothrips usitatus]
MKKPKGKSPVLVAWNPTVYHLLMEKLLFILADDIPVILSDDGELAGPACSNIVTVVSSAYDKETDTNNEETQVESACVSGLENLSMFSMNLSDDEERPGLDNETIISLDVSDNEEQAQVLDKSQAGSDLPLTGAQSSKVNSDASSEFHDLPSISVLGHLPTLDLTENNHTDCIDDIVALPLENAPHAVESSSSCNGGTSLFRANPTPQKRTSLVRPAQFPASKGSTSTPGALGQLQNDTLANSYSHFERPLLQASTPMSRRCLQSPPKKMNTSGRFFLSPRKLNIPSPKRKVAAIHLAWDSASTEALVQICVLKRNELRGAAIAVKIWKDIAEEMKEENVTSDRFSWSYEMELLLITLYSERKDKFEANEQAPSRHSLLYSEIADKLKLFKHVVTGTQCRRHMDSLIAEFRKEFDRAKNTGAGAPQLKHYDIFLQMLDGAPSLIAPVALSVGRGLHYTTNGEKKDEQRNTRTRTTSSQKASFKAGKSRQKASRSAESAQDSWMSQWKEMLERQDRRSEEKAQLIRMYIETLMQGKR